MWARHAYRHGQSLSAWLTEAAESRFAVATPQAEPRDARTASVAASSRPPESPLAVAARQVRESRQGG
jgi:hypothetical protein